MKKKKKKHMHSCMHMHTHIKSHVQALPTERDGFATKNGTILGGIVGMIGGRHRSVKSYNFISAML
jgi:hypothetical protein